jgi:hypothetical protein
MAVRSSVTCTAFMTMVPATSGLSVNVLEPEAKVAVTVVAAVSVTVQVPVPLQPPVQPVKVEPVAGAADSVTTVPVVKEVEHVAPQEMPAGVLVTVPLPLPVLVTVSAKAVCMKVAVTVWAPFIVTAHVPTPVQPPPLQPANVEPAAGVAVKVTAVPLVKPAAHVAPQEMPAGVLVTVPAPAPAFVTVSVKL